MSKLAFIALTIFCFISWPVHLARGFVFSLVVLAAFTIVESQIRNEAEKTKSDAHIIRSMLTDASGIRSSQLLCRGYGRCSVSSIPPNHERRLNVITAMVVDPIFHNLLAEH